jgi:ATP-binding cassette subfamily B protein
MSDRADHPEDSVEGAHDWRQMRRLLGYLRPHLPVLTLAFVVMVVGSLAELAQPWLTQQAIDGYIATRDRDGLMRLAGWFLILLLVGFVAESVQTWILQMTGQRAMHRLRAEVYERLQQLDVQYYDRHPVGRLMTRVTTDVDALNELFTAGVVAVIGDVLVLVGITLAMFVMDWRLTLVAFCVLPVIAWTAHWFRTRVRRSYRQVRALVARLNAFLQEHLTGMATVQLFNQQERTLARFERINREHRDVNVRSIFYYAVFYPVVEGLAAVSTALLIWYGGGWAREGTVSLGVLVAFLQYSRRFFQPISDLSEKFNILQAAMAAAERVFGVLDSQPTITSPASPVRREARAAGRIEFDHVWFAYTGEDFVLRDVSFRVEPGTRVGLVGATGSGKTTIINLLLRFYDVSRGRILVDGVDIREWDLPALRATFGLVLQDVHLFAGTIADNIRLGAGLPDAVVEDAARAVHAHEFIEARPDGYASTLAERGAGLSVGQKQLLSFARALAFDPGVLLLDEATSSIDTATEALIEDALHVIMAGRTVVAIAHRLSTIQDMDRILVLSKGELRESGTHQDLLAERGLYFRLYQLQYGR